VIDGGQIIFYWTKYYDEKSTPPFCFAFDTTRDGMTAIDKNDYDTSDRFSVAVIISSSAKTGLILKTITVT